MGPGVAGAGAVGGSASWSACALSRAPRSESKNSSRSATCEAGLSLPQFALAWVLREPNVASAIIGASRPEQVIENAGASGAIVAPELFERGEAILAKAGNAR